MSHKLKQPSNVILNLDQYNSAVRPAREHSTNRRRVASGSGKSTNTSTTRKSRVIKRTLSPGTDASNNIVQYSASDNAALVEVTVKKQQPRTKSTSREPWGQLLTSSRENVVIGSKSMFSNFDPLRTLHFLAKELQIQLKLHLPDDSEIQQIINDMQYALKRVPPEVASTIHLQQTVDLIAAKAYDNCDKHIQTDLTNEQEELNKLQKVMEQSTEKLESTCQQFEHLCVQLKDEKNELENQLKLERDTALGLQRNIDMLTNENYELVNITLKQLKEEKRDLEHQLIDLQQKLHDFKASKTEIKAIMDELRESKLTMDGELLKLQQKLRKCQMEKEKFVAIVAVRERQIAEIRSEMVLLQQAVNEQLVELQANIPGEIKHNKEIGDCSPKTSDNRINSNNDDDVVLPPGGQQCSGDSEVLALLPDSNNALLEKMNRYFSNSHLDQNSNRMSEKLRSNEYSSQTNVLTDNIRRTFEELMQNVE